MANVKPLCLASGEVQVLQAGDTLTDGAGNALGTSPTAQSGATTSNPIIQGAVVALDPSPFL